MYIQLYMYIYIYICIYIYIYTHTCISTKEIYMYETGPTKENRIYEKRRIRMKRDSYISNKTHAYEKRPIHMKRDQLKQTCTHEKRTIWKETYDRER